MCFVFIWEQTATCVTYSLNWMVSITERECVLQRCKNWISKYRLNQVKWISVFTSVPSISIIPPSLSTWHSYQKHTLIRSLGNFQMQYFFVNLGALDKSTFILQSSKAYTNRQYQVNIGLFQHLRRGYFQGRRKYSHLVLPSLINKREESHSKAPNILNKTLKVNDMAFYTHL